ncbi:hypothetical protein TWF706_011334 [Orbilia oligospora]|nr:hypothetical protein TWF706_011334 [Orbilia oligospora]
MTTKVFQDGGLVGAQERKYVRKEPMEEYFASICASIEALNLDLFPNVRKLSISYFLPESAVNNVFVAALRGIARSSFRDIMEELEIQVFDKLAFGFPDLSYTAFYRKLSESHQEMLGSKELSYRRVEEWVKAEMPELPALEVLRIFHSSIANPLDEFETIQFYKAAFYYLLLMLAPRLDELHVGLGNPEISAHDETLWPSDELSKRRMDSNHLGLIRVPRRHKGLWKRYRFGIFQEA